MVDVLKILDIDYVTTNAGSSFRGLHESILNYGGNRKPELITCAHEEQLGRDGARLCEGRRQADRRGVPRHGRHPARRDGGVQRVVRSRARGPDRGQLLDGDERRVLEWIHAAQDCIQPIRDYIKWDDAPTSLQSFNESLVRAHKIATTAADGPCRDRRGQHRAGGSPPATRASRCRGRAPTRPPRGDDAALRRSGAAARRGGGARDRRGPRRARSSGRRAARRARRDAAGSRRRAAAAA